MCGPLCERRPILLHLNAPALQRISNREPFSRERVACVRVTRMKMGETQSVMLSSFGGTWLWGSSAAATRGSSGGEGAGGRAEPEGGATADAVEVAAAAAGDGRGDLAALGDETGLSRTEAREYVSYRLGRNTFIRTPIIWGTGRSSSRFDFGAPLRTRRVSASPERTTAPAETVQKEARKCGEDSAVATCRDEVSAALAKQDATSTPDGPAEREFICSVCLELLWKPTVLNCGHSFCFWCAFQCMNVYDVSRCPLCKSAFDKFPPVSRPLDLFLLRHFPRTTKQRDKEMEEFESHRHRRSPCHSRIADPASGASTDALPAPQLQWLLEQKAPDLVRPAAVNGGGRAFYGGKRRQREEQQKSAIPCSSPRTVYSGEAEYSSSYRTLQTGGGPDQATQRSTRLVVGRNSSCGTVFAGPGRICSGEGRGRAPGSGERPVGAEMGMWSGRRLLGGDRARCPTYSEHSPSPCVRVSAAEYRNTDLPAGESTGSLEITTRWQAAVTEVRGPESMRVSEGRFSLRPEIVQEFAPSASLVPEDINWRTATEGAGGGTQARLVEDDGFAAVTSLRRSPRAPLAQENRSAHTSNLQDDGSVCVLDVEREGEFSPDINSADAQVPPSISGDRPESFAHPVEPTHAPEPRGQHLNFGPPVRETNETGRVFSSRSAENADRRQRPFAIGIDGTGEPRGDEAFSLAVTVGDWDESDGLDEGDVSLGALDPGELTTGHRRNPGDEPLQPMDIEEEELSGYVDAIEEEFGFSGEFPSTSTNSVVTETDPTRPSDAAEEVIRRNDDDGIHRDTQGTEEQVTLFQQPPEFNENLLTPEDFVHYGIHCDGCGKMPIVGRRHRCLDCSKEACGFDLCGTCKDAGYDKPGRFDQNHSNKHKMKLVQPRDAEWWIQSLNRMKKIHPELTIHQILQWILVHYQEMGAPGEQSGDEVTSPPRRENGRARAGFD